MTGWTPERAFSFVVAIVLFVLIVVFLLEVIDRIDQDDDLISSGGGISWLD